MMCVTAWLALRDKVAGSIAFLVTLFLKTLAMLYVAGVVVQFSVRAKLLQKYIKCLSIDI